MNTIRNLWSALTHFRISSVLNIAGLALALAVSYTMLVQVNYEFRYNHGITEAERVFRVERSDIDGRWSAIWSIPFARMFTANNPAVESFYLASVFNTARIVDHTFEKYPDEPLALTGNELTEDAVNTLGIKLLEGSLEPVLKRSAMAFSHSVAKRYDLKIGDRVCWGKEYMEHASLIVGAIFEDLPKNCDFSGLQAFYGPYYDKMSSNDWSNSNEILFVKLDDKNNINSFYEHAFKQIQLAEDNNKRLDVFKSIDDVKKYIRLTPLTETYFTDNVLHSGMLMKNGNKAMTYTMLALSILLLLMAYVNFFNFFVALIPKRIRSINTKKIMGASNISLQTEVYAEALSLTVIAVLFAVLLVNVFEKSVLREMLPVSLFAEENSSLAILLLVTSILPTILTAVYPAWYLTSFTPAFVLKGNFGATVSGKILRNVLVGIQFTLSFIFIIATLFVYTQNEFMRKYDMGFERNNIIFYDIKQRLTWTDKNTLYNTLMTSPYISDVAFSENPIVGIKQGWGRRWSRGDNENINFNLLLVTQNFFETLGIEVLEGRGFSVDDAKGDGMKFIFNMTAKRKYGMELGDWISEQNNRCEIIGFCNDINFRGLQNQIEPFAFVMVPEIDDYAFARYIYIRIHENADITAVNKHINSTLEQHIDNKEGKYDSPQMLEEVIFNESYSKEHKQFILVLITSAISITVSLLGVFGLVFFETEYRRSEIAVRRINGAGKNSILWIFVSRFMKILTICFVIAAPIATYATTLWLQNFAYKTPLHWWVYLLAMLLVGGLTITVVILSAWHTVNQNPAEVIKND